MRSLQGATLKILVVPVMLKGTPAVITTCSVSFARPSANAALTALTTASLKRVLLPESTQFVPQVNASRLAVSISEDKAIIGTRGRSLAVSNAVVPVSYTHLTLPTTPYV